MTNENKEPKIEIASAWERPLKIIIGGAIWTAVSAHYVINDISLGELPIVDAGAIIGQLLFAAFLISGMKIKDALEIIASLIELAKAIYKK